MINYLVYTLIIFILILISVLAIKAINRGIEAKQRLNKKSDYKKNKNKM
tara:strand:+ start:654 stop:800 length:147 start_codon:yes stop_codon:yes gene_type:complete